MLQPFPETCRILASCDLAFIEEVPCAIRSRESSHWVSFQSKELGHVHQNRRPALISHWKHVFVGERNEETNGQLASNQVSLLRSKDSAPHVASSPFRKEIAVRPLSLQGSFGFLRLGMTTIYSDKELPAQLSRLTPCRHLLLLGVFEGTSVNQTTGKAPRLWAIVESRISSRTDQTRTHVEEARHAWVSAIPVVPVCKYQTGLDVEGILLHAPKKTSCHRIEVVFQRRHAGRQLFGRGGGCTFSRVSCQLCTYSCGLHRRPSSQQWWQEETR